MRTQAIEDYLKAIYELHEESGAATTSALARRLGVAPASATTMVKKLAGLRLVAHEPYRGVVLRSAGEKIALEVIRHHRLVESFLAEGLGVPTSDPHGAPIPGRDGAIERPLSIRMSELEPGRSATVVEVSDRDPDLLRYVGRLGLVPGASLRLVAAEPFGGGLSLQGGGRAPLVGGGGGDDVVVGGG